MLSTFLCTSIALLGIGAEGQPAELLVGDAAPKLEVQEFVRGEPVKQFEHGKTYVVEFWATWCGPCRESIPHLSELQKKYKDATFLGVSIDDEAAEVKPFVKKMGDKMDYRVATDAREGDKGKMAQAWLEASYQNGIPTAYVVNGDGKVAWIGHPNDIEEPLKQILAGKWDLAAKAAEFKKQIAEAKEQAALAAARKKLADRLARALKDKRYDDALKVVEEAESRDVDLGGEAGGPDPRVLRLAILVISGKQADQAAALAGKLMGSNAGERSMEEDSAAAVLLAIVAPEQVLAHKRESGGEIPHFAPAAKIDPALGKVAAAAADRAGEKMFDLDKSSTGFDRAEIHQILARAYQAAGEKTKAAAEIKKASAALKHTIHHAHEALKKLDEMQKELDAAGK